MTSTPHPTRLILPLQPVPQHYAWGSTSFIPSLLNASNPARQPWAELWMGAHPKAPSTVLAPNGPIPLPEWIRRDPRAILGPGPATRFHNTLPFLFKVLAADQPLSIQAHPDARQAREGFDRENALRIPLSASQRNYRDPNHKPEVLLALTPFDAMKGFRPIREAGRLLEQAANDDLRELTRPLLSDPSPLHLRSVFSCLLHMPHDRRTPMLDHAAVRAHEMSRTATPDQPAWTWVARLHERYPADPGVLAPLFLNLVTLQPGEAVFLPARQLHAYLQGAGMELMANSDNVLRGGLTPKHVDAPELLRTLSFEPIPADRLPARPGAPGETTLPCPAPEFLLSRLSASPGTPAHAAHGRSVSILFCARGTCALHPHGQAPVHVRKGDCLLVPAAAGPCQADGDATLYRASIPPATGP